VSNAVQARAEHMGLEVHNAKDVYVHVVKCPHADLDHLNHLLSQTHAGIHPLEFGGIGVDLDAEVVLLLMMLMHVVPDMIHAIILEDTIVVAVTHKWQHVYAQKPIQLPQKEELLQRCVRHLPTR
jgi:hypothetical protein